MHRSADSAYRAGLFVGSGHLTMQGMTIRDMQVAIEIDTSGSVNLVNFQPTTASADVTIENPAGTNSNGAFVTNGSSLNLSSARLLISNGRAAYGFNSGAVFVSNGSALNAGPTLIVTGSRGQGVMVSNNFMQSWQDPASQEAHTADCWWSINPQPVLRSRTL